MTRCATCGNDYDRTMAITIDGETHVFDSFECAISKLAPTCAHCGCRVIGHGTQVGEQVFCSAHCGEQGSDASFKDRA